MNGLRNDIFYSNEIEYAQSSFKSVFSDYVIIGDEKNYLAEVLRDVFENFSDSYFVLLVLQILPDLINQS